MHKHTLKCQDCKEKFEHFIRTKKSEKKFCEDCINKHKLKSVNEYNRKKREARE